MDNLLSWNLTIAEFNTYKDLLVFLKLGKVEPPQWIDSLLETKSRVEEIKEIHVMNGIHKDEEHYQMLEEAMLENIQEGIVHLDSHHIDLYLN